MSRANELLEHGANTGWTATLITSTTVAGITCDVVASTKTVTRSAGSWVTEGIAVGDILTFTGFSAAGNNVDYTVTSVSALSLTGTTAAAMTNVSGDGGVQYVPSTKAVDIGSGQMDILKVNTGAITVTPYDGTTALWGTVASTADLNLYCAPIKYTTALKLVFSADGNAWVLYKPGV
jgi:hypothetical protein